MQDFPCSVHKDSYENSQIACNEAELAQFRADGWLTSAEWYQRVLCVGVDSEPEIELLRRKPGRPRKVEGGE